MDAALRTRRRTATLLLAATLPLGGCQLLGLGAKPAAEAVREVEPEPPQIVATDPGDAPADDVIPAVAAYLENLERAHDPETARAAEHAADTAREPIDPARLAPVVPRNATIEIIPEPPAARDTPAPPPPTPDPDPPAAIAPPTLVSARVYGGDDFAATDPAAAPGAAVNRAVTAQSLPSTLREWLDRFPEDEADSFGSQLRVRMLRALAGDFAGAREPLKLVTDEQQSVATHFIEAWIGIQQAHAGDVGAATSGAAAELARLHDALRRLSELSIPVVTLCSEVRGFGQYDEIDPPQFLTGLANEFVLYCEVRDFVSQQESDGWWITRFDLTTTILNHAGDTVLELRDTDITDRCRNRRNDCFIPRLVRLPATLPPGRYVAKVTLADKLGAKVAQHAAAFRIVARP